MPESERSLARETTAVRRRGVERARDGLIVAAPPRIPYLIGYARVSTDDRSLDLQRDALAEAGCRRVFEDTGSGSLKNRPQLDACLDHMRDGDVLVVWQLTASAAA